MNQDLFKQKRKKTLRSQQKHEIITFILKKTNNHVSLRKMQFTLYILYIHLIMSNPSTALY